jgi:multiple sugar transport system substrate-binding protein
MKRRTFLKATGAGVAAVGIEGILAAHRAPAFAQGSQIHILRWNDFVPAADKVLREVFAPEVQKALGVKLNVETVNANDIPARATSAIQSGSGPDIIMLLNNYPHLYASSAVDVSDIAEEVGKAQGGIYAASQQLNKVGNQWVAMPWSVVPALIAYRKSWFEEAGVKEFPKTWAQYHEAGKKLKEAKRPIGQTLGNTFGDAPTFTYPLLWSYGGQEVDDKGKVVLDSKETVESVQVHDPVLEGRARRGRPRLGRQQQQPRIPLGRDLRVAQRRLDLRRGAERRRQVQDREGRAAAHRHPACAAACGAQGRSTPTTPHSTTWS